MNESAVLIMENGRFFNSFNKRGDVITAWTLAGAKMFACGDWRLGPVQEKLIAKGKKFERKIICLRGQVKKQSACTWKPFDLSDWTLVTTECGIEQYFFESEPEVYKFCPFCGKPIQLFERPELDRVNAQ